MLAWQRTLGIMRCELFAASLWFKQDQSVEEARNLDLAPSGRTCGNKDAGASSGPDPSTASPPLSEAEFRPALFFTVRSYPTPH